MLETLENPKIDVKKIQETANAAAEKAYLKEVEDYYTSYNSPYREMVKNELKKQEFKFCMELPDILSKINSALKDEIDRIANNSIANTYIPMLNSALVGMKKELKLSEMLKEIISELEPEREDMDEYSFSYTKNERHGWLSCELQTASSYYEFTLHEVSGKESSNKYQLLSFPHNKKSSNSVVKLFKDDVRIEMPFTPNIMEDKVLKIFFKMMLSNSHIEMDVDSFYEDWFPEDDCQC